MVNNNKKHTIEFVKKKFEEGGCKLLSTEYKNIGTPMDYICECGNKAKISYDNFKYGYRCKECGAKKRADKQRIPYEDVVKLFEDSGCKLLSEEYTNSKTHLKYVCNCGNEAKTTYTAFKNGVRCVKCGTTRASSKVKHSYEYVYNKFKEAGCLLLSKEYINARTPLEYVCGCGKKSMVRFDNFTQGKRCLDCGIAKNSGKNNPMYNHNLTDEEREIRREYSEYKAWRTAVYERDDYTCSKCDKRGGITLNAHHINAYNIFPELRVEVSNGITLCQPCHKEFHRFYGNGFNTVEQLEEWMKELI